MASPVHLSRRLFPALVSALCLWFGGSLPADAQDQVDFPAAAGIARDARPVGPMQIEPVTNATLVGNDAVILDTGFTGSTSSGSPGSTGGAIINLTVRNGASAGETILASSSVGTNGSAGVSYASGRTGSFIAVSPVGTIYYYDNNQHFVAVNPSTLARTTVSDGTNTALGPSPVNIQCLTWDLATNTLLYFDYVGSGSGSSGFYRLNPVTGVRSAVSLNGNSPGSGVALVVPSFMTTDAFGNLFYLDKATANSQFPQVVLQLPVATAGNPNTSNYGARKVISSNSVGTQTDGTFHEPYGLAVDNSQAATVSNGLPTSDSLIVTDSGDDTTTSTLYRVPSNTGNHTAIITANGGARANANTGSAQFDYPLSATVDTTGRIYYEEQHATPGPAVINVIPAGTHAASTLSGATNLSNALPDLVAVLPPQPTLATPTASNVLGSTATVGGNVTADGGVTNSGIIARGFVYAPTSANNAPKIGGTGVTQVLNFVATSLPVAQNSNLGAFNASLTGLTQGTGYTVSAYAQNVSGFNYSAPLAFTTATTPSVTTSAATGIAGASATLNGNVTADGGASLTARGFVYASSNTTPTLGGSGVTNLPDATAATGTYADAASGLAQGTTYYFRAYATNGVGTTYGSVLNFKTFAAPTANSQSVSVAFNTATAVTLTGSDPNSPAQSLTYNVTSNPGHGTLSGTAPNLTYTPTTGYNGTDSFQFTVTNTSGLTSSPATVTLTVAKGTPTANSQSVSAQFNTATAVTLTGSDPDVPALTLTYTVVTAPAHGTLSGTAPNLTYTPTANYQGTDSFTFRVSNGTNTSNTATVSITVAAGVPTANSQSVSTGFNTAASIALTGTDPDNPPLSLTYTVTTAPSHGTLAGTAPNLTYTPTANYQGSDSFQFTVSNGQKTSNAATVSITVAAGTPTANAQSVNVNLNRTQAVTLTGTDPDSPALSLTYTVATAPANGTLAGTAPNLTYTPNTGYSGTDSFTFTVSNGQKTSAAATVSLTVIGQPTISSFTPASGPAGTTVTVTGTNLQNATGLNFFRNVAGTNFTVVSSTQVTVRVPAGATTGTLIVLTGSGSNNSSTKFAVTP